MIKRLLDIAFVSCTIIILLPILAVVALLDRIFLGSPILFVHRRPEKIGKLFSMYKFRTMSDARNAQGNLLSDDIRLTAPGRFLRSTSIDVFPGFVYVIKGDTSIVGPRPLLPEYLERYSPHEARRQEVKRGITGWDGGDNNRGNHK